MYMLTYEIYNAHEFEVILMFIWGYCFAVFLKNQSILLVRKIIKNSHLALEKLKQSF